MKKAKTLGEDESYFEGSTAGWLIVTRRGHPLLHSGQIPMFWNRDVARFHLQPWMREGGCMVVRADVKVRGRRQNG